MIKFINLQLGNVYDGSKPFVHWFEGQHSTNLIYTQPIGFLSDKEQVTVSIDKGVFSVLDMSNISQTENINEIDYVNLSTLKKSEVELKGIPYNNFFIYIAYFSASAATAAEYVESFYIDKEEFNIGIDLYAENEPLYINASNMGVEIPESVQKTIYDVNVHEEKKDNITLNRKFKELISNYWDMIANKGSYKSLLNCLEWFEWGDVLRIREIWKHEDFGKKTYEDRPLNSILEEKYKDTLTSFAKTTYISLYCALQQFIENDYDSEKNPALEDIVYKWARNDMALKMCLLGNFYQTYFMPIHLDLLHMTLENQVFTNTIKNIPWGSLSRYDMFLDCEAFECTINNNKDIILSNVSVGVDKNTLFSGDIPNTYEDTIIIGVKPLQDIGAESEEKPLSQEELKLLYSHNYNGPGVIIPIKCTIPLAEDDIIKHEKLFIKKHVNFPLYNEEWISATDYKIFQSIDNKCEINFNILLTDLGQYTLKLRFEATSGKTFEKTIDFTVYDISNVTLEFYKVQKINISGLNKYLRRNTDFRYSFENYLNFSGILDTYQQYIPIGDTKKIDNIGLNNVVAISSDKEMSLSGYSLAYSYTREQDKVFIFVSNKFTNDLYKDPTHKYNILKNSLEFIPQFHIATKVFGSPIGNQLITPKDINNYIIDDQAIYIRPFITSKEGTEVKFDWAKYTMDVAWTFHNQTTGENFTYKEHIATPIIAARNKPLSKGYYDIIFKYTLISSGKSHIIEYKSVFVKK